MVMRGMMAMRTLITTITTVVGVAAVGIVTYASVSGVYLVRHNNDIKTNSNAIAQVNSNFGLFQGLTNSTLLDIQQEFVEFNTTQFTLVETLQNLTCPSPFNICSTQQQIHTINSTLSKFIALVLNQSVSSTGVDIDVNLTSFTTQVAAFILSQYNIDLSFQSNATLFHIEVDALGTQVSALNQSVGLLTSEVATVNQSEALQNVRLDILNTSVIVLDGQVVALNQSEILLQSDIVALNRSEGIQNTLLDHLNTSVTILEGQVAMLNQTEILLQGEIAALNRSEGIQNVLLANLNTSLTVLDTQLHTVNATLDPRVALLEAEMRNLTSQFAALVGIVNTQATRIIQLEQLLDSPPIQDGVLAGYTHAAVSSPTIVTDPLGGYNCTLLQPGSFDYNGTLECQTFQNSILPLDGDVVFNLTFGQPFVSVVPKYVLALLSIVDVNDTPYFPNLGYLFPQFDLLIQLPTLTSFEVTLSDRFSSFLNLYPSVQPFTLRLQYTIVEGKDPQTYENQLLELSQVVNSPPVLLDTYGDYGHCHDMPTIFPLLDGVQTHLMNGSSDCAGQITLQMDMSRIHTGDALMQMDFVFEWTVVPTVTLHLFSLLVNNTKNVLPLFASDVSLDAVVPAAPVASLQFTLSFSEFAQDITVNFSAQAMAILTFQYLVVAPAASIGAELANLTSVINALAVVVYSPAIYDMEYLDYAHHNTSSPTIVIVPVVDRNLSIPIFIRIPESTTMPTLQDTLSSVYTSQLQEPGSSDISGTIVTDLVVPSENDGDLFLHVTFQVALPRPENLTLTMLTFTIPDLSFNFLGTNCQNTYGCIPGVTLGAHDETGFDVRYFDPCGCVSGWYGTFADSSAEMSFTYAFFYQPNVTDLNPLLRVQPNVTDLAPALYTSSLGAPGSTDASGLLNTLFNVDNPTNNFPYINVTFAEPFLSLENATFTVVLVDVFIVGFQNLGDMHGHTGVGCGYGPPYNPVDFSISSVRYASTGFSVSINFDSTCSNILNGLYGFVGAHFTLIAQVYYSITFPPSIQSVLPGYVSVLYGSDQQGQLSTTIATLTATPGDLYAHLTFGTPFLTPPSAVSFSTLSLIQTLPTYGFDWMNTPQGSGVGAAVVPSSMTTTGCDVQVVDTSGFFVYMQASFPGDSVLLTLQYAITGTEAALNVSVPAVLLVPVEMNTSSALAFGSVDQQGAVTLVLPGPLRNGNLLCELVFGTPYTYLPSSINVTLLEVAGLSTNFLSFVNASTFDVVVVFYNQTLAIVSLVDTAHRLASSTDTYTFTFQYIVAEDPNDEEVRLATLEKTAAQMAFLLHPVLYTKLWNYYLHRNISVPTLVLQTPKLTIDPRTSVLDAIGSVVVTLTGNDFGNRESDTSHTAWIDFIFGTPYDTPPSYVNVTLTAFTDITETSDLFLTFPQTLPSQLSILPTSVRKDGFTTVFVDTQGVLSSFGEHFQSVFFFKYVVTGDPRALETHVDTLTDDFMLLPEFNVPRVAALVEITEPMCRWNPINVSICIADTPNTNTNLQGSFVVAPPNSLLSPPLVFTYPTDEVIVHVQFGTTFLVVPTQVNISYTIVSLAIDILSSIPTLYTSPAVLVATNVAVDGFDVTVTGAQLDMPWVSVPVSTYAPANLVFTYTVVPAPWLNVTDLALTTEVQVLALFNVTQNQTTQLAEMEEDIVALEPNAANLTSEVATLFTLVRNQSTQLSEMETDIVTLEFQAGNLTINVSTLTLGVATLVNVTQTQAGELVEMEEDIVALEAQTTNLSSVVDALSIVVYSPPIYDEIYLYYAHHNTSVPAVYRNLSTPIFVNISENATVPILTLLLPNMYYQSTLTEPGSNDLGGTVVTNIVTTMGHNYDGDVFLHVQFQAPMPLVESVNLNDLYFNEVSPPTDLLAACAARCFHINQPFNPVVELSSSDQTGFTVMISDACGCFSRELSAMDGLQAVLGFSYSISGGGLDDSSIVTVPAIQRTSLNTSLAPGSVDQSGEVTLVLEGPLYNNTAMCELVFGHPFTYLPAWINATLLSVTGELVDLTTTNYTIDASNGTLAVTTSFFNQTMAVVSLQDAEGLLSLANDTVTLTFRYVVAEDPGALEVRLLSLFADIAADNATDHT